MKRKWWVLLIPLGHPNPIMGFLCLALHLFLVLQSDATGMSQQQNDAMVGLIAFRHNSVSSDPKGVLASWTTSSSNPCSWHGVICSSDDLLYGLNLSNSGLIGSLQLPDLAAVPGLKHLNLRGNSFSAGNLSAALCHFETIDLSSNNLSDPFPEESFLLSCDGLYSVNLSHNSIPGGSLRFGPSLRHVDLSRNKISNLGLLSSALSNCQNLVYLNFSDNGLAGNLNVTPLHCKSLSFLDLSYNLLSGEIPSGLVREAPASLKYLDLSHNNLSGQFSSLDLGSCINLSSLNLSQNKLSGFEFPATMRNCLVLETINLSHNELQQKIPGSLLGNLKSLKKLSLAHNMFVGEIPFELGQACGTLEELDLSANNLTGGLPSAFASCTFLRSLNLGHNRLYGDFLSNIISNLPSLRYLYLPFNNLTGTLPLSLTNCTQLQVLDLSSNSFFGNIPSGFCSSPASSALEKIFLADNFLSGKLPEELGNCKNLRSIDLSFNTFSGAIPSEIWNLPHLSDLVMWANKLTGTVPDGICVKGGNLETLILNNNFLSGTLPESIGSCTNMIWVSLSSNHLTGEIPAGIGNLAKLAVLQLGNNSLTGQVPPQLGRCKSLIWLDLNSNNLTGVIPSELANQAGLVLPGAVSGKQFAFVRNEGGTSCRGAGGLVEFEGIRAGRLANFPMVHSCPSTRIYSGSAVYTFARNGSMIYLDLSYNYLTGNIPENFGAMSYLQVLNLGHNMLTGKIPDSFGNLKAVGVLDLSHNYLQGFIPGSLGTLTFITDLDVSNNNLTGAIPSGGQLTTFPTSRYENNSGLCGLPLPSCSIASHSERHIARGKEQPLAAEMVSGITFFLLCTIGLIIAVYRMKKYQSKEEQREKYIESLPASGSGSWKLSGVPEPLSINVATFEKPLRKLTFAHLLEATNGFSADSLIGSGGFGEVYKAKLRDGAVVAIKKLIHVTNQGDREFIAEMETIGKIKHRNLVPLLGYCKVGDERLLVYEYMKWGSLEFVLHERVKGGGTKLDWSARKKIAIGSARGLAFLHHSCIPHIIHRDMKSSNVLLDENFEPRVSDFGMARLVNALDTHLSVSTLAGTPGYVPPEYFQSFRCTTKGDVYSYGVILLELLSGKKPIDSSEFGEENNLVGWAKQLQKDSRSNEILDPKLLTEKTNEAQLHQYLKIAFQCLDDRPFKRPTMVQVMAMFKELQVDTENDIFDGLSLKDAVSEDLQEKER